MKWLYAAVLCLAIGVAQNNRPPSVPKDATKLGSGTTLLDTRAAKMKVVEDSNLAGGFRATCRWLYWHVYTRPTGRSSPLATQVCNNACKGAKHNHAADCTEGGCYTKCGSSHSVTLESQRGSERSESISKAVEKAVEICVEVGVELGFEKGPITAGISGSTSKSSTETQSLERSISSAISQSVTGSVEIQVEHFNDACCSKTTNLYGTYEYEVVLVVQALEQDYYCESWVVGLGTAGVLPSSGLKATGYARYIGSPTSTVVATYELPSNEPLSSKNEVVCKCKPQTATPSGGSRTTTPGGTGSTPSSLPDDQSSLPKGSSKIIVAPDPNEDVYVHNPYGQPIICSVAGIKTTLEPGQSQKVAKNTNPVSVILGTVKGVALMGLVVDSAHKLFRTSSSKPKQLPGQDCTLKDVILNMGETPIEWKEMPGPALSTAPEPPSTGLVKGLMVGNMPVTKLPILGNATPVMQIAGEQPLGCTYELAEGGKVVKGTTFAEIRRGDTVTESLTRFTGTAGMANPELVVRDAAGTELDRQKIKTAQPTFRLRTEPESGPVGSPATLVVDCREILTYMDMDGAQTAGALRLSIDYSQSGGASGPKTVDLPASGVARVNVKRGGSAGSFNVIVGLAFKEKPKPLW